MKKYLKSCSKKKNKFKKKKKIKLEGQKTKRQNRKDNKEKNHNNLYHHHPSLRQNNNPNQINRMQNYRGLIDNKKKNKFLRNSEDLGIRTIKNYILMEIIVLWSIVV